MYIYPPSRESMSTRNICGLHRLSRVAFVLWGGSCPLGCTPRALYSIMGVAGANFVSPRVLVATRDTRVSHAFLGRIPRIAGHLRILGATAPRGPFRGPGGHSEALGPSPAEVARPPQSTNGFCENPCRPQILRVDSHLSLGGFA